MSEKRNDRTADAVQRLGERDWDRVAADLDASGHAILEKLLTPQDCRDFVALFEQPALFRKHVVMARHGYGQGDYKYFAYPLPEAIGDLRAAFYERLLPTARDWSARLGGGGPYPERHADYLAACHEAGQRRPTCLLLRYGKGDYNRLHQDLYGALAFPLQAAILLSEPGKDFTGGEFVLTEQRARMQSRAEVVPLKQGDAVVFANALRPITGVRGTARVNLRHGVSPLRGGRRLTLGLILHDAA